MEGMVVRTKGDELRGVVHQRERLPIEGISAGERVMNWLAILRHERRLRIRRGGITILTNVGIGSPAHGGQIL